MTSRTLVDTDDHRWPSTCWCCGAAKPETELLRLGARPDAAVCLDCVPDLRQRAGAHGNPPAVTRHLHNASGQVRRAVMSLGLHEQPVVGPALRWISRRSPF